MIDKFEKINSQLHDARLFGFFLEIDENQMDLNFIVYAQVFSDHDFDLELYSLEKVLVIFKKSFYS